MSISNYNPFKNPMAEQIWDMKYRLKEQDGTPIDLTVQDSWRRIAWALAENETDRQGWADKFYAVLERFQYIPAGRINAGAGTDRNVTLFNCFVMGTVHDSLTGIMDALKEAAVTMQAGGGIGYDFSTLRPIDAPVKGVAATASGPLSFMDVWDAMCRTIMSAGVRRGAMMATMRVDHPDIFKFIDAKRDPARLRMFNLSVLVTDEFMQAVKDNSQFELKFGGKVYRTVSARGLWDHITQATYAYAEPGVIFIDRINKSNNLGYCETIASTNPCVSGDTDILTEYGYQKIIDLVGGNVNVWNGEDWAEVVPYETGENELVRVHLTDGNFLDCTWEHKWVIDGEFTKTEELKIGDKLSKFDMPVIDGGEYGWNIKKEAYSQGFYSGDGSAGHTHSYLYHTKYKCEDMLIGRLRSDTEGRKRWIHGPMLDKAYVPIEREYTYRMAWLAGLLDSDGSVSRDKNGNGFQIVSVNHDFLNRVRLMLTTMGVRAKVTSADAAGYKVMPNGRGGEKEYYCQETKRLLIGNYDAWVLMQYGLGYMLRRLKHNGQPPQRDARQFVRVKSIEPLDRFEMTYCFTEPKTGRGTFNGIVTGQCGEQPLPPYGACLLGSMNIPAFLNDDFSINYEMLGDAIRVAVRMMDNVIDVSRFPLPAQENEAKDKRRIGLGVTGVADAMALGGVVYGSDAGVSWIDNLMQFIAREAYLASVELAKERGPFPLFDAEQFLASGNMMQMHDDVRDAIRTHGIRNALLTSIAPTGTISLYAGNVSSGIEPIFAMEYDRKVMQKDGSKVTETVRDYAVDKWRRCRPGEPLPASFVTAQTLLPIDHVKMQAAAQRWVDSSISKTINCPEDISFDDFKNVYLQAWEMGCKGCTTYRPNDVTGSVLSVKEDAADDGGACELKYDESTGQLIRSCE